MTNAQNPIYAQLKSAIEFDLKTHGDCAATRFLDDVSFDEVQACFEAIAAEKGLQDAKIVVTDETFSRGTLDVLMSWAEIE